MTHSVKICCSGKCKGRGSERLFTAIEKENVPETTIEKTTECMGYCGMGPNVSVNGNILHGLHSDSIGKRIRDEIVDPSAKVHGLGSKTIDDLDSILDNL
jgi:NADH:ubiquinone oxidoreductase subunit E